MQRSRFPIPGQGTKIPHVAWHNPPKKSYENRLMKGNRSSNPDTTVCRRHFKIIENRCWDNWLSIFKNYLSICLFLAVLGLHCCSDFSLFAECRVGGSSSVVEVHRLLIAVASVIVKHGLQGTGASVVAVSGLSSCGSQALEQSLSSCGTETKLLHCVWDFPTSGIKAMSSALTSRFFITEPPGKPLVIC